jgi:hypothetical protein
MASDEQAWFWKRRALLSSHAGSGPPVRSPVDRPEVAGNLIRRRDGAVVRKEDGSRGTREPRLPRSRVIVGRDGLIRRLRTERVQYWRQHDRDRQIEN